MANVVFVVAGTAAVVVAGATNWMPSLQSATHELSEEQWLATAKVGGGGTKIGSKASATPGAPTQTKVAGQP